MKKIALILLFLPLVTYGQYTHLADTNKTSYQNTSFYQVINYTSAKTKATHPKNIVFLIGDGMGAAQVFAGLVANKGALYLQTMPVTGFSKTSSANNLITDSAAGATALSTGEKTKNGAVGVDTKGRTKKTLLEMAEEKGLATGMVVTCSGTHATPASFIAHQANRGMTQEIAADFLKTDFEVLVSGGRNDFDKRRDGRNLLTELKTKGYDVVGSMDSLQFVKSKKVVALVHENQPEPYAFGRGEMLKPGTAFALEKLHTDKTGFFLMVEGSQIDWGGHDNDVTYVVTEMLDFDRTVGEALKFAAKDGETLVIVTSDHETGGFAVTGGNMETGLVVGKFTSNDHTAVMVPVFAYGPGADHFSGIMENTDIFTKIKKLMHW